MNKINKSVVALFATTILFCGCADKPNTNSNGISTTITHDDVVNSVEKLRPWIRPATSLACAATLNYATSGQDRIEKAKYIAGVSGAMGTLLNGSTPSPELLQQLINLWTPSKTHWVQLSADLKTIYETAYTQYIKGDYKLACEVIGLMCLGASDAANTVLNK